MSVPFREEETGALARAEALEIENQELREEIERLKDRVGENRDAYVTNLEEQLRALKAEVVHVKSEREKRLIRATPLKVGPDFGLTMGAVGIVSLILAVASFLLRR